MWKILLAGQAINADQFLVGCPKLAGSSGASKVTKPVGNSRACLFRWGFSTQQSIADIISRAPSLEYLPNVEFPLPSTAAIVKKPQRHWPRGLLMNTTPGHSASGRNAVLIVCQYRRKNSGIEWQPTALKPASYTLNLNRSGLSAGLAALQRKAHFGGIVCSMPPPEQGEAPLGVPDLLEMLTLQLEKAAAEASVPKTFLHDR